MSQSQSFARWEGIFRAQMKFLREQRGVSQTELARQLSDRGLSFHQQTVQRVEQGDRAIRLDEAYLIAEIFDVELSSMTDDLPEGDRELLQIVDTFRRRSLSTQADLQEVLAEWVEEFEVLAYALFESRRANLAEPTEEELWLSAWVLKGVRAYKSMYEGLEYLVGITSTTGQWRKTVPMTPSAAAKQASNWLEHDRDENIPVFVRIAQDAEAEPDVLYSTYRDRVLHANPSGVGDMARGGPAPASVGESEENE